MNGLDAILRTIRTQADREQIRITQHAQQEMVEESISMGDLLHVVSTAQIIENYPKHRRGACCLLHGTDASGRDIHLVCTTAQPMLIIITAYLPVLPKWVTPTQRRTTP